MVAAGSFTTAPGSVRRFLGNYHVFVTTTDRLNHYDRAAGGWARGGEMLRTGGCAARGRQVRHDLHQSGGADTKARMRRPGADRRPAPAVMTKFPPAAEEAGRQGRSGGHAREDRDRVFGRRKPRHLAALARPGPPPPRSRRAAPRRDRDMASGEPPARSRHSLTLVGARRAPTVGLDIRDWGEGDPEAARGPAAVPLVDAGGGVLGQAAARRAGRPHPVRESVLPGRRH